jgi:adenine-specific DNA-methyltransferase
VLRTLCKAGKGNKGEPLYQVEVLGFDYYDTKEGKIISGSGDHIAVWMLDTDYDGRSIFPRQVFFPMAGDKEGWSKLAKNLKAQIDEDLIRQAVQATAPDRHRRTNGLP